MYAKRTVSPDVFVRSDLKSSGRSSYSLKAPRLRTQMSWKELNSKKNLTNKTGNFVSSECSKPDPTARIFDLFRTLKLILCVVSLNTFQEQSQGTKT